MNSNNSSSPSSFFAQSGNTFSALNISKYLVSKPWIIDSRASNHMTNDLNCFHLYNHGSNIGKVTIADRSFVLIIGKGSVSVSSSLTLDSILHVPKISCNVLSINKVTKSWNSCVTFYPTHCIFQDLAPGKRIGSVKGREGLYYLNPKASKSNQAYVSKAAEEKEREIWLLHFRYGNLNFISIKTIFPDLFFNVDLSKFQCQICELSKNHQVPFPLSNKKSEIPCFHDP